MATLQVVALVISLVVLALSMLIKRAQRSKQVDIQRMGPGFAFIRNALDKDTQCWLADFALKMGNDPKTGFWRTMPDGSKTLNSTPGRGRIYQALHKYPEAKRVRDICMNLVKMAQTKAEKLPNMEPTHLLLLYYATSDGMGWHRDSDPNDGDNDQPIVSISLGNSSQFGYKPVFKPEQFLTVDNSDVLVWGGPQRMLEHCVKGVKLHTSPSHLPQIRNVRLNFTFRSAPNILGKEEQFESDKYWVDPST
jgi:alkylated DNA repair dioxygenase AlkB